MNKILETIDFEIYKLNEKYKMDYAYSDPRTNETLVALTTLESLRGQLEPLVSQENGGHLFNNQKENKMKNTPVDDTFIYKIVLQDTVVDEQKEERFVLARDFNDAVQLACEMCEANDYVVIQTTEIGYVDYCTSKIAEYFSRFSG